MSFTLHLLNCTAALVLEGTDGKARAEVESSADEFEIAPVVLRAKPDAD